MRNEGVLTAGQIEEFLTGSGPMEFGGRNRTEIYAWVQEVLVRQEYFRQGRLQRGTLREYLCKVTGVSLPQMTRLIRQQKETGEVRQTPSRRRRFAAKYTSADIALLAEVDRAHERLSGPATRRILQREYAVFDRREFSRLSGISSAHIYNLRGSAEYRRKTVGFEHTKATGVSVAERRRPDPKGRPGYIRIDTVHQGDREGKKGVYHINAVDTVTQWQIVGCAEKISEAFLLPVLEAILHQFPFQILGFHSDNGSEFINHQVAGMLEKMLVEFTKSRANRSQDNGLAEAKNAAVIRKLIGYGHIPAQHAEPMQRFYTAYLNPYLNYHRPCGFATAAFNARGKRTRSYKADDYRTPYEKLKSLPEAEAFLKEGVSFEMLDRFAKQMSDTECARRMGEEKEKLLCAYKVESPFPAPRR